MNIIVFVMVIFYFKNLPAFVFSLSDFLFSLTPIDRGKDTIRLAETKESVQVQFRAGRYA